MVSITNEKVEKFVDRLYKGLFKQYGENPTEVDLKSLNVLCVRLVFCLYAENIGFFGEKRAFHDYIKRFNAHEIKEALKTLFEILNTKPENRQNFKDFPHIDNGLFSDESIKIPHFTEDLRNLLLGFSGGNFEWCEMTPIVFGSVFESTLNPETRRFGGMHYTSTENINKVINPLFFNDLRNEFNEISQTNTSELLAFHEKISNLKFLDPACGSGNFLIQTYLSLRELEKLIIKKLQIIPANRVKIENFYGIEINEFAGVVAKTALWIAENQTKNSDFTPLNGANIVTGNALRVDWGEIIPKEKLNYIIGNPPFVGASLMNTEQKKDLRGIFGNIKNIGYLDYVTAWFKKASVYTKNTEIKTAFVSSNSVAQGVQPTILWRDLMSDGVHINFGVSSFKWNSEAKGAASVYCVIEGFSHVKTQNDLNPYLLKAPVVFLESRDKPICDVPEMCIGNKPIDGGNYLFSEQEKAEFIKQEPDSEKYFFRFMGAKEFINGQKRYCLYLKNCTAEDLLKMPKCKERVNKVAEFRRNCKSANSRKLAEKPQNFQFENLPDSSYIFIPRVSSENRKYIPMGFLDKDTITSDSALILPNAEVFHFAILTSSVHMAWVRAICGRLKNDYRYSNGLVYNNFPWVAVNFEQKEKIADLGQKVLDIRQKFLEKGLSLADLYGNDMDTELKTAHNELDKSVLELYGFSAEISDSECVAELMKMHQGLVDK